MTERQFYDYIQEHFTLDGTSSRLVFNIIDFVKDGDYDDAETAHRELWHLLGGAFGLTEEEVKLYREELSLAETLKANAEKSREMFPEPPNSEQREKERDERE